MDITDEQKQLADDVSIAATSLIETVVREMSTVNGFLELDEIDRAKAISANVIRKIILALTADKTFNIGEVCDMASIMQFAAYKYISTSCKVDEKIINALIQRGFYELVSREFTNKNESK